MFLLLLVGWTSQKAVAQSINLTLKYNTSSSVYEVYGRPTFTNVKFGIGAGSQISIVVPASVPDNALTITAVNGGPWSDGSRIYAPTADPAHDFHGIATTGDYASLTSGQELLLFTFNIAGGCMPGIRLFENSTDPSSNAAGMGGGDFANYLGDAVGFGTDVYGSNYVSPGGLCGTPPTLAITGPSGTQTSTSPTVSGTATPGSVVSITGPNNATLCSTTATAGGSFSCVVSVTTGPATVTVTASNASGTTTATTSFTAVPAPTLAVTPTAPGPLTQPVSGTTTPGDLIAITDPTGATLCSTTASANGTFACTVTLPPGSSTLTVASTGPGGTTAVALPVTAVLQPTVGITGPSGTQTSTSPTVSGTATPGSVVTITGPNNATLCSTTATAGGTFSCVVSVPTGPVTVTATATNFGGTVSSTTSFTALSTPVIAINPTVPGPLTQPISGTTTPGSVVTITGPGGITACSTTASANGSFSCSITVPTGPTTYTVTTSGPGGTTTVPVTTTGVAAPTLAINGPSNTQTSTSPTVSGTATPGSVVSITGPGNATLCSTTATAGGSFSCTVSVATGPATLTVTASNPGGTATSTTSFTAAGAPTVAVNPPVPGPITQPIAGTATPGSVVTITGPGNTTLCSTTASASGAFSCSVTLPTGPTSITVTTTGPGGTTSVPLTVTAVAAPTVAINGPATGSQTSTSPTVSGTATPGSQVTITGPGNATLCSTTATAGGSFSCVVSVATGPVTVTVTAANAGGTVTATTSFVAAATAQLSMRVLLQGALTNSTTAGRMRDDLRSKNLIPTTEPYTALGFAQAGGGGGEAISSPATVLAVTGANAIVDWIFVELRSAANPAQVLATRSALLQADGDIVGVDGVSALNFTSNVLNNVATCYVAVRHRNHLGVMTASPVSTSALSSVDFTNAATAYQLPVGNALRTTAPQAKESGYYALWAGNTLADNQIVLQGPDNDADPVFFDILSDTGNTAGFTNFIRNNVYSGNDIDMDGRVIFQGPNNEIDYIFFNALNHPDNVKAYANFIIKQQLP
ncbi:beta strand repeat-containing protein [Spirosoma oryzae]|nr:Ig-like domain-containing protein [Spirosoma oryzae]